MRLLYGMLAASVAGAAVLGFCGFAGQIVRTIDVPVIVTSAPAFDATAAVRGEERFTRGAQLLIVRNGKGEPLIGSFAATADASVSFDAKGFLPDDNYFHLVPSRFRSVRLSAIGERSSKFRASVEALNLERPVAIRMKGTS